MNPKCSSSGDQFADLVKDFANLSNNSSGSSVSGGALTMKADPSVTTSDIGKIMVNKYGLAKVAQRDTPSPGQVGKWLLTVNSLYQLLQPTIVRLDFNGDPSDGDSLRIGWITFTFRNLATGRNDIPIIPGNIPAQVQAVANTLSNRYGSAFWTATTDMVGSVTITMNPNYDPFNTTSMLTDGALVPAVQCYGGSFDAAINNTSQIILQNGDGNAIRGINNTFLTIMDDISYADIFYVGYNTGTPLFGQIFPTTLNDFATAIAAAINRKLSDNYTATASDNVVTITTNNQPVFVKGTDLLLSSDGANYCTLERVQYGIADNAPFVNDPVLGTLLDIKNGVAYISGAHLQQVKLSGQYDITINLLDNSLNFDAFVNRVCLISDDGTVESIGPTLQSVLDSNTRNFDTKLLLQLFSKGCLYWAMSGGKVGDVIIVSSQLPTSLYLFFGATVIQKLM